MSVNISQNGRERTNSHDGTQQQLSQEVIEATQHTISLLIEPSQPQPPNPPHNPPALPIALPSTPSPVTHHPQILVPSTPVNESSVNHNNKRARITMDTLEFVPETPRKGAPKSELLRSNLRSTVDMIHTTADFKFTFGKPDLFAAEARSLDDSAHKAAKIFFKVLTLAEKAEKLEKSCEAKDLFPPHINNRFQQTPDTDDFTKDTFTEGKIKLAKHEITLKFQEGLRLITELQVCFVTSVGAILDNAELLRVNRVNLDVQCQSRWNNQFGYYQTAFMAKQLKDKEKKETKRKVFELKRKEEDKELGKLTRKNMEDLIRKVVKDLKITNTSAPKTESPAPPETSTKPDPSTAAPNASSSTSNSQNQQRKNQRSNNRGKSTTTTSSNTRARKN